MPEPTDLVTNLPADFEVFGQAVDTDFADLNGGTTGQVLSKTSATDLDFTWTTPTDQTPLTTKGDLFTFTTTDARIGVGTTGQILSANPATATGLEWVAANPGDITGVTAGTGISGGGTSGDVTVSFDYAIGNQAVANTQTDSYTLVLTDAGKIVVMNKATANTLTVPPNSSVAFGTNTRIDLLQYGAGQTTIAAGAGVTIYSSGSKLKLTGQYSGASLWKQGTDTWVLIGDIAA